MGDSILSARVLRERKTAKTLLRQWQIEDARRAWRASIRGFFVRLIFFSSLGFVLLVLALLQEL
jgi:hypothetical protein